MSNTCLGSHLKVVIGCDGVNSVLAKWLGLEKPVNCGRSAIRGFVEFPDGHNFQPRSHVYFGEGVRYGFRPCDDKSMYWFFTFKSSLQRKPSIVFFFFFLSSLIIT